MPELIKLTGNKDWKYIKCLKLNSRHSELIETQNACFFPSGCLLCAYISPQKSQA